MNTESILALISDLYGQVVSLQKENEQLRQEMKGGAKSRRNEATRDAPIEEYQSK